MTSLKPKTLVPTGDDSLEMEIQDLKFDYEIPNLSEVSTRVH
jgi:hypothetical protein